MLSAGTVTQVVLDDILLLLLPAAACSFLAGAGRKLPEYVLSQAADCRHISAVPASLPATAVYP